MIFAKQKNIDIRHLFNDLLRDFCPIVFALRSLRLHNGSKELANDSLELAVIVGVVWAVVSFAEPSRLAVGDPAQFSRNRGLYLLSLSLHSTNLESLVLRAEENFMSVQTKEDLGSILSS